MLVEFSFQYGSVEGVCEPNPMGDSGKFDMESFLASDLSLDCVGALWHTLSMVSSVSRESV